jgi:hypothetical protein
MAGLSQQDLVKLVQSVFPRFEDDRVLGILVDVPRTPDRDNPDWKIRRAMAADWHRRFQSGVSDIPLEAVRLLAYPDVGSNNADLPDELIAVTGELPPSAERLGAAGERKTTSTIFSETQIFLAPTEYSTTAPLKNAAARHGFRAATMPGFSEAMIPALRIDYGEVGRRVALLKEKLDRAESAAVEFDVEGAGSCHVLFDLRFRNAHMSSGRFPEKGTAGNLPSGETYIVPYEGEHGEASRTSGVLPVEIGGEIVDFTIENNRALAAEGAGTVAREEQDRLTREPAYGNMAELGFGVLGDFGVEPVGEILLDEKLGLHIAFGRSDHFGGRIGPKDFSSPSEVVHLDRIYIPAVQPRVRVRSVVLFYPEGPAETVMQDGRYLIF